MALTAEQMAAAALVGGGETALHSHTGGGGGADVKSGIAVASSVETDIAVTFVTAFTVAPRVVLAPEALPPEVVVALKAGSISTTGFTFQVKNGSTPFDLHWIATDAGNA